MKFDQESNFSFEWPELGLIKSRIRPKQGENEIFKGREWYYTVLYTKTTD